jgi:two-component system, sensor histidine kinase and response regulator
MTDNLRILIVEDNENDADLLNRELKKSGIGFTSEIVQTSAQFEYALQHTSPDIILSDYSLPSFDAVTAFDIKQNTLPDVPFIIVSGIIGEENAVELIKIGVTDYAPKNKLFTLSQKIDRALKELKERKEKEIIAEELKTQTAELLLANKELNEREQLLLLQDEKLKSTNDELLHLNQHLEKRVYERTCELENLNHELKALSLSKDKLLSVISHDLRNPFTALLIASEMLNDCLKDETFQNIKPFAQIINKTSKDILAQLNELIDWAKIQQEKTIIKCERIHLVNAVDEGLNILQVIAVRKGINLRNNISNDLYVTGDSIMLRSIFQNLVTNSLKYTLTGGFIVISAQAINKMVEISITDTGTGMETAIRDKLFSSTNDISLPGTNNEKGSGMGLKLVKDFVNQHGGKIRVESEIEKGTGIFFTMPLSE